MERKKRKVEKNRFCLWIGLDKMPEKEHIFIAEFGERQSRILYASFDNDELIYLDGVTVDSKLKGVTVDPKLEWVTVDPELEGVTVGIIKPII